MRMEKRRGKQECRKESSAAFSSACLQYSLVSKKRKEIDVEQMCAEKKRREEGLITLKTQGKQMCNM